MVAAPGSPALADAAMRGDKDTVRSLLKQAVDVNEPQGDGMTALHWAAMKNDADLVQMLLYAGANLKATTRIGSYTPLVLAAREGFSVAMEPLLKAGADPNVKTANGTTALMLAAQSGNAEAVSRLLDAGADLSVKEPVRGLTAVMFAAASDRAPVVELLAKRGADLEATSSVIDLNSASRNNPHSQACCSAIPRRRHRRALRQAQGRPGVALRPREAGKSRRCRWRSRTASIRALRGKRASIVSISSTN